MFNNNINIQQQTKKKQKKYTTNKFAKMEKNGQCNDRFVARTIRSCRVAFDRKAWQKRIEQETRESVTIVTPAGMVISYTSPQQQKPPE